MSISPPSSLETKTPPPSPASSPKSRLSLSPKLSPFEQEIRTIILAELSKIAPLQPLLQDPLLQAELATVIDSIILGFDEVVKRCEECLPSCWDKFWSSLKSCLHLSSSSPSPPGGKSKST